MVVAMLHGFAFLLLSAELVWVASGAPTALWFLGYPALSFGVVGVAYLTGKPALFGKRADGRFAPAMFALHLPFHGVAGLSARLRKARRTEPYHEIVDGLWLGERTNALPPDIERIVDLTVEHARIGPDDVDYVLIATLDAQAPDEDATHAAISRLVDEPRTTYVHCFAARGRSATFVAAYLLSTGVAETVDDAEAFMKARRPVVSLGDAQRALARRFEGVSRADA